ncbi:MAG: HAD family hydrolase [Elusimicrobia bacterium]|nr:HAD family hydrolase [Elusimicrobiota bacterium]
MIRACALDFDGVVLESVGVKLSAFERLFAAEPQGPAIARYFRENNGLDRYTKFRHVWTAVLGRAYDPAVEAGLDSRFNAIALEEVLRCPFVPGAEDFLRDAGLPLYVVSASPLRDLTLIVEWRGLAARFKGLYGSPGRKAEQLRDVLARERLPPDELVFVGDSPKDLAAAREAGTLFVGRRNAEPFGDFPGPLLDDLRGLRAALGSLAAAGGRQ